MAEVVDERAAEAAAETGAAGASAIDTASRLLGGPVHERGAGGMQVTGAHDGQPIIYTERLGQSVIVAPLPARIADLILNVFPEREFARRQIEGGRQIDVTTGDAVFDPAYVVEAAPKDVAAALLDAPLRRWMTTHRPEQFQVRELGDDEADVRVELGQLAPGDVGPAIAIVARFASGLAERAGKVAEDLELSAPRRGGAYRGEIDAETIAAVRRTRAAELAELRSLLGRADGGAGYLIVLGLFTLFIGFIALLVS